MNTMDLENFDDEKYYRNVMKDKKKFRKTRRRDLKVTKVPKTKPKTNDYHLIARRMRAQKRESWYSKLDTSY